MTKIWTIVMLLSGLSARAQTGSTVTGSIRFGGLVRDYRLYVPTAYRASRATPLLLNLHGYGSNNQQQEGYGDFRAIADTANFLVLHPNGTIDGSGYRYWNTFSTPNTGGPDDVAFIAALLDTIAARYTVDPERIYSTGMSNGGFMSYELACRLGGRVAAIASVTGSIATTRLGQCAPTHPTPVMEIHGTADGTVPYTGSSLFTPIPNVLAYWVQANGCNPTPTVTAVPNTDPTDGSTAERSVWRGPQAGALVEHYRIIGGGHTWPGATFSIGVTNRDISASREIWRFLRGYRLSQLTAVLAAQPAAAAGTALHAAPNPATNVNTVLVSGVAGLRAGQLRAYDALGRAVPLRAVAQPNGALQIETADWVPGIYVLKATTANGQESWVRLLK